MADVTDEILLKRLKSLRTREIAFKEIYIKYYLDIVKMAFMNLKDSEEAADVAQEVFITFWLRKPFEKKHINSLHAYLMKSCSNICNDHIEKKNKEKSKIRSFTSESPDSTKPNQIIGDANRQLAILPKRQREVVRLVVIQEFSHLDTAHLMGISIATVRSNLLSGIQYLRQRIRR